MGACPQPQPHLLAPWSLLEGHADRGTLCSKGRTVGLAEPVGEGPTPGHVGRLPGGGEPTAAAGPMPGQAPVTAPAGSEAASPTGGASGEGAGQPLPGLS